jgi:dipeptidyl-peptidase-4
VAQEELDRPDGFWLSPKGGLVAFEQVDESHIPAYRITHQGEEPGLSPGVDAAKPATADRGPGSDSYEPLGDTTVTFEEHRFPFSGAKNPAVKLGVVSTKNPAGDPTWFDLTSVFGTDDFYLAKVEWLALSGKEADASQLVVQLLDRRQLTVAVVLLDCGSGSVTPLHVEAAMDGGWINLNDSFRVLKQSSEEGTIEFLWASERDGYRHLYVLEASTTTGAGGEAKVVRRLTGPGEFIVDGVAAVDDEAKEGGERFVYYMGTSPGKW